VSSSSLISPVVGHLADLALWEAELAADGGDTDALAVAGPLVQRLRQVPDPRRARGRRHCLVVILALTACATLVVGNDSVAAIWQWAARTPQAVLRRLGARFDPWRGRHTVPSERTFRRVLTDLDGDTLDQALGGYVADVSRGQAPRSGDPGNPGVGRTRATPRHRSCADPPGPGRAAARRRGRRQAPARDCHRYRPGVPVERQVRVPKSDKIVSRPESRSRNARHQAR
jgi:hypothetical protein